MTYQTAYKLLVAAYKSAKGIMPEGLDLLKIKQKARQKVIDAKKVIKFPQGGKDKINPFEPRPKFPKKKEGIEQLIKKGDVKIGQAPKTTKRKPAVDPKLTQEENIKRIMAENKASAKRLQEKMNKPEKSLGEKLKDYNGDPDAMAVGGIAKLMGDGIKTALKRTRKGYDIPGADFQVLTQSDSYLMSPPNMQMLEKLKIVRRQLVRDIKRKEGGGKYTFGPDPKATKKDLQLLDEYIADLKDKIKVEGYYGKGAEAEKSLLKSDPLLPFSKLVKDKYRNAEGGIIGYGSGGKVKKPFRSKVVDFLGGPAAVGAELGLSGLLEVYNLLGMPLMKDGGIMKLAVGGIANISDTYDNNPTLQSQYPNKQDYLDLFSSQTTTTTPEVAAIPETTTSTIAPINPIKPIIKIPQSDGGDGGGGITTIDKGLTTADQYGFGPYGNNFNDPDVQDEIDALNPGGVKGFMQGLGNFYTKISPFLNAKKVLAKSQDFALDIIQKAKDAAAARELAKLQEAARAAGFQGDTRTQSEQDFASSQTYGGGGSRGDMGADTFDI